MHYNFMVCPWVEGHGDEAMPFQAGPFWPRKNCDTEIKNSFEEFLINFTQLSYLGMTACSTDKETEKQGKTALTCRCLKNHHTYNNIATELDNIHSPCSIFLKITSTIIDNGHNFIKVFNKYQPVEEDESGHDEDMVNFMDICKTIVVRMLMPLMMMMMMVQSLCLRTRDLHHTH